MGLVELLLEVCGFIPRQNLRHLVHLSPLLVRVLDNVLRLLLGESAGFVPLVVVSLEEPLNEVAP